MSLTGHLKRGPVRDWFEKHFHDTSRVCTEANRELRGGRADTPCAVPLTPGADPGLVGTAVGYLLSAHLREDALDSTAATTGARLLDRAVPPHTRNPASVVEREVVKHIKRLRPWSSRRLEDERWTQLCELVCILARFEQRHRAGVQVLPYLVGPLSEHSDDLSLLANALVTPATLEDLSVLGRATVEDHGYLRDAAGLVIAPEFTQSFALGEADADLIYEATLIDLKSSSQPGVLKREDLWQLLGYFLADTHDSYGIQRVGFAALRRRRSILWAPEDFAAALGGNPATSLTLWREEFAGLLHPLAERRAVREAQRAARPQRRRLDTSSGA